MNQASPQAILSLARNFMESRILLTGAELNLFPLLAPAPLPAQEVASRIGGDWRALTILLDSLVAMDFLVKENGKYQCPSSVSPFLSDHAPRSIQPMVLHMAHLWQRWSGLTDVVRGLKAAENLSTSIE